MRAEDVMISAAALAPADALVLGGHESIVNTNPLGATMKYVPA
jgi:hypothetical protein